MMFPKLTLSPSDPPNPKPTLPALNPHRTLSPPYANVMLVALIIFSAQSALRVAGTCQDVCFPALNNDINSCNNTQHKGGPIKHRTSPPSPLPPPSRSDVFDRDRARVLGDEHGHLHLLHGLRLPAHHGGVQGDERGRGRHSTQKLAGPGKGNPKLRPLRSDRLIHVPKGYLGAAPRKVITKKSDGRTGVSLFGGLWSAVPLLLF